MAVDLKSHPGLNPDYFRLMEYRKQVQRWNRAAEMGTVLGAPIRVPPQPNKYRPHTGAKQLAKGAAK